MMDAFRSRMSTEKMHQSSGGGRGEVRGCGQPVGCRGGGAHRLWGMAEFIYTLRNVRKAYGDKVVLDNVTLNFLTGAKIGVVGPNGTGKSSLFKIMARLEHPNNGEARLAAHP